MLTAARGLWYNVREKTASASSGSMPSLPADPLFLTELISTLVAEAEAPAAELEALGERGIRVLTL